MEPKSRHGGSGARRLVAAVLPYVVCLSYAAVALCAAREASGPQGAFGVESARNLIAELGPQQAAEQVSSDSTMLEAVASGVVSARHEWLDVGAQLMGGAEAHAYLKDRLVQAFSHALLHDAAAVLERGASGVPVEAVCRYDPFFGAEAAPTRSEFDRALAARERAVAGVKRADLGAARDRCLAALRQLGTAGAAKHGP
jgi:hypothetical protein